MRKAAEREEARRLFVEGQYTLDEIHARTGIPARTLRDWSGKEDWSRLQKQFVKRHTSDIASLEDLIREMEKALSAEQKRKLTPAPGRLFALTGLREELRRMKGDATRAMKQQDEEKPKPPPLSSEHFLRIEQEVFGLRAPPQKTPRAPRHARKKGA